MYIISQQTELVQCPACGEHIPLLQLRKHERNLCINRRVPCRNQAVGCNVMVRLGERALHEHVDGSKQTRSTLYMASHGACLSLQEDDIPCPWTAEVIDIYITNLSIKYLISLYHI